MRQRLDAAAVARQLFHELVRDARVVPQIDGHELVLPALELLLALLPRGVVLVALLERYAPGRALGVVPRAPHRAR